jgi:hypothetical protein
MEAMATASLPFTKSLSDKAASVPIFYYCSLNTAMATSGHISAHSAQPVHLSGFDNTATVNPRLLGVSLMLTSFFGQAMVQSPQPLHRSSLMEICGMIPYPFVFSGVCYIADIFICRQAPLTTQLITGLIFY